MGRTGPEQGDIALLDTYRFIVDQILDIAVEGDVHLHLTVPVAGGHGIRSTQLDIHPLVFRVERQRAAGQSIVAAAHIRVGGMRCAGFIDHDVDS